ncbi:MAG: hypothetical protein A2431_01485 [Candidatus Zambryskibacteria bacterium RIFOXYC1_FULL_39_10]|uniref:Type 4 fimbrial biogenesis protein PilX N-terminal domain-containing protein n=1 Tax=Candidatus Zambryskibacteria bacterium RIFOXYC1_FULL_39_10 TaxID=1802779 RepID=A0A1G2V3Y9_9BACT|nr:MAG: hypothetical protein A2605_03245 [Candidatus Zambryskibacteria bacterium RIFOXYD1_FULL_39_35]OHB16351.1 MAG: hypothetical protein A2431_01485 [Candidatus Zambryskibacteria bacterium RIFOXYC1_FULL_39_10]
MIKNKGMTLFIAVSIMGVLLFISFAVVNVAIKGSLFATSGRDSQFAFYAADSGLECALYWDSKYDAFSTSSHPLLLDNTVYCAGSGVVSGQNLYGTTTVQGLIGLGGDSDPTSRFSFLMDQSVVSSPCAVVTVRKYYSGVNLMTYIKSRGYNTCEMTNPRRVERGIEVTY